MEMNRKFAAVVLVGLVAGGAHGAESYVNVALGKPVTFQTKPNYWLTKDDDDARQLTDGKFASKDSFWTDRGACVGWSSGSVTVGSATIDLGEETPIAGFSWQFAFGRAGVRFPESINVYVSSDGKTWYFAGALLDRALTLQGTPPPLQYRVWRAHAEDMPCRGRYVRFIGSQKGYLFCDELEVYRGDDSLLKKPHAGVATDDPLAYQQNIRLQNHLLKEARLVGAPQALVDRISREVVFADLAKKPTVLPLCDVQRDVWAANAVRLRAHGVVRPAFWTSCRWENLSPVSLPPDGSCGDAPVVLDMMRNEVRAETVNVVNPTDAELTCDFSVEGLGEDTPLDCREVLFTDSKLFRTTASALKPGEGARTRFAVPAGVSKQVWISVRRPKGAAGLRTGALVAKLSGGQVLRRPFHVRLRDLDFPERARLHVGGWDYLDWTAGKKPANGEQVLALHRDLGVDVPWGAEGVKPRNATFDAEGDLVSGLDFTQWDHWTKVVRPDARMYAVYLSVRETFHGEKAGTPRFERMVVSYLKAWIAHARDNGLNGRRIALLLVDEPSTKEKQDLIFRWMKPIRAAGIPEFASFEDPQFAEPWNVPAEFWDLCDIICPITDMVRRNERVIEFWTSLAARGKEVWLYSAHGPSRTFDPISYYRMQAWTAFRIGSKESATHFWDFAYRGDSWRAYSQPGTEYCPYYVSPTCVMDAKQSEAIREGVEDYEYLSMLAEKAGREKTADILKEAFGRLPYGDPDWEAPGRDHALLDRLRSVLLDRLEREKRRTEPAGTGLAGSVPTGL